MKQLNLKLEVNPNGSITANWSKVDGAVRYHAYMSIVGKDYACYNEPNLTTTSYTSEANLEANRQYKVIVAAYDNKSYCINSEAVKVLISSDFYNKTPLEIPTNIKAVPTTIWVTISFDQVERATSYDILFDGTVYNTTTTNKKITGLKPKTSYTYAVRAKNANKTGAYSATKTITTLPQAPTVPADIKVTGTENSVTISWKAVANATGYDLIFNGTAYSVTGTSKTISGLRTGESYKFQVRSKNADAVSSYSTERMAKTIPKMPTAVNAVSDEKSITINWSPAAGADTYRVKFNGGEAGVTLGECVVYKSLQANTLYTYQICACNTSGCSAYTPVRTVKTAPMTPKEPSIGATKDSVTISWSPVSGATSYDVMLDDKIYRVTTTSKTITGLQPGTNHTYAIRANNADGSSSYTEVTTISTIPNPPGMPDNVMTSVTSDSVTISWSPVAGASSYEVVFNGKTYKVTEPSVTISGLEDATAYHYKIRAINAGGNSSYTESKVVSTKKEVPPVPTGFKCSATGSSVKISWAVTQGATSYDILFGNTVYNVTETSKTIGGLTPGTTYTYAVRANNSGGSGAYSEVQTVSTIPDPPIAPKNVSATATMDSATVKWDAVSGATSYALWFGSQIYQTTDTSMTISGLASGVEYEYRVCAKNAGGSSAYSNSKTIKTTVEPPTVPTGINAQATSNSVTVSWNRTAGATGYDVSFNGVSYSVTGTSQTITGLKPETSYTYAVRAKNSSGNSAYSATYTVKTLMNPPAVPTNIRATATTDTVTISWNPVAGAINYDISMSNGCLYRVEEASVTICKLTPDTEYTYAVCARNEAGVSAYSARNKISTLQVPPVVPTGIIAYAKANSVTLEWNHVVCAENYEILFDGTAYSALGTEITITELNADTDYVYQIRAENSVGVSEYSEEQIVRTLLDTPINISAKATADTVTISWYPVAGADCYDIVFNGETYSVTDTIKEFTGLKPVTEYRYSVCARNAKVESEYSRTQTITTKSTGPAEPTDVMATATMKCVVVSFSPVELATSYDIEFDGVPYHVTGSGAVTVNEEGNSEMGNVELLRSPLRTRQPDEIAVHAALKSKSYGMVAATASVGEAVNAGKERIFRIFAGLKPGSNHTYCVRANNEQGSSNYSPCGMIRTKISQYSGLAGERVSATYPDGKISYMGSDPVNALTGAFLWSYTWLENYGKDKLHFTAMYDSQRDEFTKVLGYKWTYSLNYILRMEDAYAYFSTPYNEVIPFRKNETDGSFELADEIHSAYIMMKNEEGSYVIRNMDGTEYIFNAGLCLEKIVENGAVVYRFCSDEENRVIGIEGRYGAKITLSYEDCHIAAISDAAGNKVAFCYKDGYLTSAVKPDGKGMYFTYDEAGNLLTVSDFTGKVYLTNQYDMLGKVTKQHIAGRGESQVHYDEQNRVTIFTDELGNETKYCYDENGHITNVELAGIGIHNKYNENGQLTEQTDALGNITKMTYDECGRMNCVTYPDGTEERAFYNDRNQPIRLVERDGSESTYEYDTRGNLISVCDERGNTVSYTYDDKDNLVTYTDKSDNVWTYGYDENHHLKQAVDAGGNIYRYSHDAVGRMISHTSPTGALTSYTYAASGELLNIEDADGKIIFDYNENGSRTGVTDKRGNKQRLEYNEMGQVSLATDFMGNEYRFTYDERGNLINRTDPLGYHEDYGYDAMGNCTSWTDKNGYTIGYSFDGARQLTEVRDAAGGTVKYVYDAMGQVKTVTDQLEHVTAYDYDRAGRFKKITDALGNSVSYTYDAAGNLLTKTDEEGAVTVYTYDKENRPVSIKTDAGSVYFIYDKLGRVIEVEDTDGYSEKAAYDADDNLTELTDKESNRTTYQYDMAGRLVECVAPNGGKTSYVYDENGNCTRLTDAEGNVHTYTYDANNRLISETDPLNRETVYAYDGRGQLISVTDAKGGKTVFEYDGNGNLVLETNPLGGVKSYTYDSLNRLTESVDEEGYRHIFAYDAAGNMTAYTDANENRWDYTYDAVNRLTEVTDKNGGKLKLSYTRTGKLAKVTDQEGAETNYRYDSMGRLLEMSDALSHSMSFTYDNQGRVLTQTDANGNTTQYSYSPAGNLLSVKAPEGNITSYTYNALGQVLTVTDSLGNVTGYEYDALGQVTAMTDAMGGKTTFTYTANGQIATVTDANGGITRYVYDACGNLTQTVDPLGNTVVYEYDATNNQIKEYLSAAEEPVCTTLYRYDKRGCMVQEMNPLLDEKAYVYDGNGNAVSMLDEDKNETTVRYDLNNLPVQMCYSDGREAAFRYNKRGELVELKDWNGITAMEYDLLGRLTKVTDYNGHTVGYDYDANGNRTGITYPDGSKVSYCYDKNNRMTGITDAEGKTTQYHYDAAGNILSISQPGSVSNYAYNAKGLPTGIRYAFHDGLSMEESISYDAMGRITGRERKGNTSELIRNAAYSYDAAGQLLTYREGQNMESYVYDALGNRIAKRINGREKASYRYNALNQLTDMTENGIRYNYAYDRRGNLTEERKGESLIRQYTYDATNHMVLGRNLESGEKTEYGYNALYMRVKNVQTLAEAGRLRSREIGYVTDFLSSTNNDLMAYEKGFGTMRTVYGRGYERLSQKVIAEPEMSLQTAGTKMAAGAYIGSTVIGKSYFQPDMSGSPLFAANEQGEVLRYAERGAWGGMKLPAGRDRNFTGLEDGLRFTGYLYDPVIGMCFAQARFYDSTKGRMLSKDPVKRGLNGYPYCGNDPLNQADSTGEIPHILIMAGGGGIIGGASGFVSSAVSQLMGGEDFSLRKALGSAANGFVVGAARGAMLGTGVGIPAMFAGDFMAGTAGSALEQKISRGSVDIGESITGGLTNAVSGLFYGGKMPSSLKGAFLRGAGSGAATAGINNLSNALRRGKKGYSAGLGTALRGMMATAMQVPYLKKQDPRSICGVASPFRPSIGYRTVRGYHQADGQNFGSSVKQQKGSGFSLSDFLKDVAVGAIFGGVSSAAFYGLDKAVGGLKQSIRRKSGTSSSKGGLDTIIKNGKVSIDDIKTNPSAFSGKSAEEIADVLRNSGYDVTIKNSTRSRSGAQIIQINNSGGGKNISQVQVSPGGGRHGSNPYVKISTTDQGIIKIVDGIEGTYKTDGKETATIIFSGGN